MKHLIVIPAIFASFVFSAYAADQASEKKPMPPHAMQLTKQQRADMAAMHEKMAACLRTEKPVEECHSEMAQGCKMAESGQCPMMGMMGMPHHMMGKPPKGMAPPPKGGKAQ